MPFSSYLVVLLIAIKVRFGGIYEAANNDPQDNGTQLLRSYGTQ
jgi:hypothetical protein